jgi:hypothetical protein
MNKSANKYMDSTTNPDEMTRVESRLPSDAIL